MGEVQEMFRNYLQGALDRGQIDPVVELDALLPMIMAVGQGFGDHRPAGRRRVL